MTNSTDCPFPPDPDIAGIGVSKERGGRSRRETSLNSTDRPCLYNFCYSYIIIHLGTNPQLHWLRLAPLPAGEQPNVPTGSPEDSAWSCDTTDNHGPSDELELIHILEVIQETPNNRPSRSLEC